MSQVPCVIVDVMRGGPSTGLPTEPSQGDVMQARWGTHGEHSIIALVPELRLRVLHPHGGGLQSGREVPHAGDPAQRRARRPHERGGRPADGRGAADRRAGRAGLRSVGLRHGRLDAGQHPAPPAARLALQGARHRPGLQPPQRRPGHRQPRRGAGPGPLPAREDLPAPRVHHHGRRVHDGGRRGGDLRLRLGGTLGARRRAVGARPGSAASAWSGRSPSGRSRRRPSTTWPSRSAR